METTFGLCQGGGMRTVRDRKCIVLVMALLTTATTRPWRRARERPTLRDR